MAVQVKQKYTSVTVSPPPNFESGPQIYDTQVVSPDGSGNFTIAPCWAPTLAMFINNGWGIVSLSA